MPVCGWSLYRWESGVGLCLWESSICGKKKEGHHGRHVLIPDNNWPRTLPSSSELQTCQIQKTYHISNYVSISIIIFKYCIFEVTLYAKLSVPHLTLALSTPIPKLIVATMTGTFPSIQSVWESVRSPAFRPAHTDMNVKDKNSIICIFNRNLDI